MSDRMEMGRRLDALPITALHVFVMALCATGFLFDLMEITLGSALAAVFSTPPHVASSTALATLLASVYVGAAIGAPLLGWLADRRGRRQTLTVIFAWLAVTSIGAATSDDIISLTLFRGLAGLALGACPPLVVATLTDLLPASRRGQLLLLTIGFATLGAPAGIFLLRWLSPISPLGIVAWRWGFIVGGGGAFIVATLFSMLPESPRWLAEKGLHARAEAAIGRFERSRTLIAALVKVAPVVEPNPLAESNIGMRHRWAIVGGLFLLSPWSTVAFPLLCGAILAQRGFHIQDTLLYVGSLFFGPCLGNFVVARVIDRLGRRGTLALCISGMLVAGCLFAWNTSPSSLIVGLAIFGVAAAVYLSTLTIYGAELFTTDARARSLSGAWALNRIGAAAAPLLLLPLLHKAGAGAMLSVIAATLALSLLLILIAPPGRQGQPVH